jgi:hypothetical protein
MEKKPVKSLIEKSDKLRKKSKELLEKANQFHNKAISIQIEEALKKRLSRKHYELRSKLKERDLVIFSIAEDYYMVGVEEYEKSSSGNIHITLCRKGHRDSYRSLDGCKYPIKSLVGYYQGCITPEETGREDLKDLVLINPSVPAPDIRVGGLIQIPLEAIVDYQAIKYIIY